MSGMAVRSSAAAGSCKGDSPHCTLAQWFKVVLLGDARVGKTSLIRSLKHDQESWELSKEYKPTAGAWVTYFDLTDRCRLLITDASGKPEHSSLVNLYLRQLHCVVFVFALDDYSSFKSLSDWYHAFTHEFTGVVSKVAKFVVGTKTDAQHNTTYLQLEAKSFAEEIGAEMWITSAAKSFNTRELFTRIAKMANTDLVSSSLDAEAAPKSGDFLDGPITSLDTYLLDDMFLGKGALVRYPDPVLLNTEEEEISHLVLSHQCVIMTGENKVFKWGTWSKGRSKEAVRVLKSEDSITSVNTSSKLWSCVMANSKPSTWQYENLEGVIKYGTTVRRQPTKTEFKRIKKLLFTSRDKLGQERNHGLFYMLLQSEDNTPSEVGLNSVFCKMSNTNVSEKRVIENNFRFKPAPVSGSVTCMSMSSSHAAVVNDDNKGVSTWGRGKDGALGLEEHLISNFDPPFPIPVTSINCHVKEVCCGAEFTLILTNEGQVYSCGSGALGKLGHGDETDRPLPSLIESLQNIQSIATGGYHAVALTNRGVLYQWGQECANEALTKFKVPTKVNQVDNVRVTSVACGAQHSVCVTNGLWYTGVPFAWGRGSHGRLGLGHRQNLYAPRCIYALYSTSTFVKQVSAGGKHSGFLTVQGEVYTCGNNAFGQLGYFTPCGDSDVPLKVCLGKDSEGHEIRAKELVCKEDYTMILTTDGDVMLWGKCFYGSKLEDPIPLDVKASAPADATDQNLSIKDVTTCFVPTGESYIELVVALTNASNLLFCAGISPESDCQAMEDRTPQIRCNKSNLTTLCSAASVLVSMDQQGKAYYVDIWQWLLKLLALNPQGKKTPTDLTHALFSKLNESDIQHLPTVEFAAVNVRASVTAIEASLSTFVFCSTIGDLYSWSPKRGGDVVHHKELDNEIVVKIACGASHLAALSDNGKLYTCGDGRSGQLGLGTCQTIQTFKLVPLTDFHKAQAVRCGWASTAVLAENGKVFFWGQLDLPSGEKTRRIQSSITTSAESFDTVTLQRKQDSGSSPAEYKVEIKGDTGIVQNHLAVVGRSFEIEILQRNGNTGNSSCTEFRAEAVDFQDSKKVHSKGTIKQSQKRDGTYVASLVFYSEGSFRVSITRNGKNVLGSPFKVNAEKGVLTKRSKLTLIGSDFESMRAVGGVLQKAIDAADSGVELWGVPSLTVDLLTQEALILTSITDGGIYIYVWDASCGNLSEENLNFWLYLLSLQAPSANVILLGVNISKTHANEIDLKPFQTVNPMMKRSIFAGTTFHKEPDKLLDEVLLVVSETNYHQSLVWYRLESLASKVLEMKRSGIELLDHSTFKCIAGECGIQRDFLSRKAAEHLELTGMGLRLGGDSFFFVLQPSWLVRHLTEITRSSHLGALDRNTLDSTKQHIVNLLIEKRVAVERMDKCTIDIIPYLPLITEENWPLVDESNYTVYRHLILTAPPYHIHSIFQSLVANVLQEYRRVTLGKYSLVICSDQYQYRVDCGPCMINKTMTEVRVIVRAGSQDQCRTGAATAVGILQRCFAKFGSSYEIGVKVSCRWCRQYYVDLSVIQEAAAQDETERECGRCHGNRLPLEDVLNGFEDTRPIKELDWKPYHGLQHPGGPYPKAEIATSNMLLRPLMRYFGDREERYGAKLLKEIKAKFEDMTKVFMDIKNCDVPRTVCVFPELQRSSIFNTNAIKMLLTYGQPKYRLFLLCEGNGDGTGVHFLDHSKHKGYLLEDIAAEELIKKNVERLRFALLLLTSFSNVANFAVGLCLFDVVGTLNNILGTFGLSGTMLCAVPWKDLFKEMDGFLKRVEETSDSIPQPKDLSSLSGTGRAHRLGGESYENLRKRLSEFRTIDDFGGLRQEPREGIGVIWVCPLHSKYNKDNVNFNIMP